MLSHSTHRALHCLDILQCESEHLFAITTITAHTATIIRITDLAMKLQTVLKALYNRLREEIMIESL